MMSGEDYELIAKAIKESWPVDTGDSPAAIARRIQCANTARHICKVLAFDNSRFDQLKFEKACGTYAYNYEEVPK